SLATYSIFATFPAEYFGNSWWGPLLDQIIGTGMLLMLICAVIDTRNTAPMANLGPFIIGLIVVAIGLTFGTNAGYAINPARDFGPRLFTFFEGWGDIALPGTFGWFSGYWWIPIVGPLIGGAIGVLVYDWLIGPLIKARTVQAEEREEGPATPEPEESPASVPPRAGGGRAPSAGQGCHRRDAVPHRETTHQEKRRQTMPEFVGAVDQGTTSTRFMIFDHSGNEVGKHQLEHRQILPKSGWVEHDPVEIW